jgi:hypothetical protein
MSIIVCRPKSLALDMLANAERRAIVSHALAWERKLAMRAS